MKLTPRQREAMEAAVLLMEREIDDMVNAAATSRHGPALIAGAESYKRDVVVLKTMIAGYPE